ncbi:MAG: helix-hairpin-helix domain-containing protein, partial [Thermoplasmatota archaeon]
MEYSEIKYDIETLKNLQKIPYVGDLTARVLIDNGFKSTDDLETIKVEELAQIKHIGLEKAREILRSLKEKIEDDIRDEIFCPECEKIVSIPVERCPECRYDLRIKNQIFLKEGTIENPHSSLAEYEKKIMDGIETPKIWYNKGAILEGMNSYEKALNAYNRVIELDPLYDQIWTAKANIALKLGKIMEAAKAYKIAVNKEKIRLPTDQIVGEDKEFKEFDISAEEVESKITTARDALKEVMGGKVNTEFLNSKMHKAVRARNENKRQKAIDNSEEVIEGAKKIKEVTPLIKELDDKLKDVRNIENYISDREKINDKFKKGDFKGAKKTANRLIERLNERRDNESKFSKYFDEAKNNLRKARDANIKIDKLKQLIKIISECKKENNYKEGITKAKEAIDVGKKIIEINNRLIQGKKSIAQMKKKGLSYDKFLGEM